MFGMRCAKVGTCLAWLFWPSRGQRTKGFSWSVLTIQDYPLNRIRLMHPSMVPKERQFPTNRTSNSTGGESGERGGVSPAVLPPVRCRSFEKASALLSGNRQVTAAISGEWIRVRNCGRGSVLCWCRGSLVDSLLVGRAASRLRCCSEGLD